MGEKEENGFSTNLRLTTIVYREGEWSPELLSKDVSDQYMYCEMPKMQSISNEQVKSPAQMNSQEIISEYADLLKDTMIQNNINPENVLYIAATQESLHAAQMLGMAVLGYDNRSEMGYIYSQEKQECVNLPHSLSGVKNVVEGFEEVDALFLERVYEREHHLPWEIARTDRWILREFTMEDMDGLVELYDQPGVAYRIVNGDQVLGYIEPLLPRAEEEEYQRCYIENMYGFYGYGMWIVTENTQMGETDLSCGKADSSENQRMALEKSETRSSRIIGRAGLENREYEGGVELEMGYVIDPRWQHRGIAYEVCSAIMEYARENTDFPRLNALTEADNVASIALLEKLGFTYLEDTDVSGSRTRRYVYDLKRM